MEFLVCLFVPSICFHGLQLNFTHKLFMEHLHSITGIHMWLYKGLMRTVHDMLSCWWVKITTYYRGDWVKRERGSEMSEATKRKMYTRCTPNSIKNCLELNLCNLILFRLMRMDADGIYTYIYARTRMHASTFTFRHPLHIKLWFVFVLWCKMCKDTLLFLLVHKIKRGFCLTYFCLPAHRLLSFFSHPCVCVCCYRRAKLSCMWVVSQFQMKNAIAHHTEM